jgi:glycerol-3-phosphate cytidylyltransferase
MKKYKTGYITGVFDLFHVGHLNAIRAAKEMCEHLIVGVSTDEHVMDYKKKKPVIPFNERFEILEAIRYADKVVPQNDYDKMKIWEQYRFNAIFTGSDWKGSELWSNYERQFNTVGVDVVYLPYTQGISSTLLINVLQKLG